MEKNKEDNERFNYELRELKDELERVFKILEQYRTESEELLQRPSFNRNDPQNCENILNKMKTINQELKVVKQKFPSNPHLFAVYPNFPKSQFSLDEAGQKKADEAFSKAFTRGLLLTIGTSSTNDDNIINEKVVPTDETFDTISDNLKKLGEFRTSHNSLIDRILLNRKT